MKINLTVEIDVEYNVYKSVPRTRHYPGDPADVEVLEISLYGHALSHIGSLFNAIVEEHGDEIEEACMDDAIENEAEDAMAYAEHMRDVMEDR